MKHGAPLGAKSPVQPVPPPKPMEVASGQQTGQARLPATARRAALPGTSELEEGGQHPRLPGAPSTSGMRARR